jgi:hypothetical protein
VNKPPQSNLYRPGCQYNPGPVPEELKPWMPLTFVEEQLIAAVHVSQYIYFRRGRQQVATKSHCICFPQNLANFAQELPRLPADCNVFICDQRRDRGQDGLNCNELKVRRKHIEFWLNWLSLNSPYEGYRNVRINQTRINALPLNGVPDGLPIIETDQVAHVHTHGDNHVNILEELRDRDGHSAILEEEERADDVTTFEPSDTTCVQTPPDLISAEADRTIETITDLANSNLHKFNLKREFAI